jgi:hypothetical protein
VNSGPRQYHVPEEPLSSQQVDVGVVVGLQTLFVLQEILWTLGILIILQLLKMPWVVLM